MITPRASFGCIYSPSKNEIFVAGGYTEGQLTKKTEKYIVSEDKWVALPDLTEAKCSMSLCQMEDGRFLYAMGGLNKLDNNSGVALCSNIERLDLTNLCAGWHSVPVKLAEAACDIGCINLSRDEILIFGGWNKNPLNAAYILKKVESAPVQLPPQMIGHQRTDYVRHEIKPIEGIMERPDFFLTNGIAMKVDGNPNHIKICGHTQMFIFDLKLKKFVGTTGF